MSPAARAGVFLDRDGTIIEEIGYLDRVERVVFYPWTVDAVRALNRAGLPVVLVTNQSGVARGFFSEAMVDEVHAHIASMLEAGGARLDAYYYCPHHPDGKISGYAEHCQCRKPGPGLVDRAARELGIDPRCSFVVGDRWVDVALARTVGAKGVLLKTGYGLAEEARAPQGLVADAVADNLVGAVNWILRDLQSAICNL